MYKIEGARQQPEGQPIDETWPNFSESPVGIHGELYFTYRDTLVDFDHDNEAEVATRFPPRTCDDYISDVVKQPPVEPFLLRHLPAAVYGPLNSLYTEHRQKYGNRVTDFKIISRDMVYANNRVLVNGKYHRYYERRMPYQTCTFFKYDNVPILGPVITSESADILQQQFPSIVFDTWGDGSNVDTMSSKELLLEKELMFLKREISVGNDVQHHALCLSLPLKRKGGTVDQEVRRMATDSHEFAYQIGRAYGSVDFLDRLRNTNLVRETEKHIYSFIPNREGWNAHGLTKLLDIWTEPDSIEFIEGITERWNETFFAEMGKRKGTEEHALSGALSNHTLRKLSEKFGITCITPPTDLQPCTERVQ